MTNSDKKKLLAALEANWQAEMEGYCTYTAFAKDEVDPQRRNALRGLAAAEKHHADLWAGRIQELGAPAPQYVGHLSGQADSFANRVGGADLALRRLEIDETRDIAKYGKQLKALGDQPSVAILEEVIADEREHYQTLGNLIRSRRPLPAMTAEQAQEALDDLLTARDKGHPQAAAWVGDAIYGINDGLGSIFGIVSGVSGATLGNSHFVLIAGLAGIRRGSRTTTSPPTIPRRAGGTRVVLPAPGGASITRLGLRCRDEMISGNRTSTGRGDVQFTCSIEH